MTHQYISMGCSHERHDRCNSTAGSQGAKRPSACTFCGTRCGCPCHALNQVVERVKEAAPSPPGKVVTGEV